MRRTLLFLFALPLALACRPQLGEEAPEGASAPTAEAVVARVGEHEITLGEVDSRIKQDLFERQVTQANASDRYEIRRKALEALLSETAIEQVARSEGLTSEQLIVREAEALGPVTDDDISAFYEERKAQIRAPLAQVEPRIRAHLEAQRTEQARLALQERAEVSIDFEPPRVAVAAVGPSIGPEDAPVTIIEFSDYQCPYCARAEPTIEQVLERYSGRVRFVYRHLPLEQIHPQARAASLAAICADRQGKFWEYHKLLFANQRALGDENLRDYAEQVGLEVESWGQCTQAPETAQKLAEDMLAAAQAGIQGTPGFLVNGILLSGARPFAAFEEVIEDEIARAGAVPTS
jgi:protein-disulfide isomerase